MISEAYLVINRRGIVRLGKRQVQLKQGELMVKLQVQINPDIFSHAIPVAELNIDHYNIIEPMDVSFSDITPRLNNRNQ